LNSFGGNVKRAAKALGINPSTVHRKLAAYSAVSGPDSQRKNTQDEARS
jgi:DNA-binding NtrC family response regulator